MAEIPTSSDLDAKDAIPAVRALADAQEIEAFTAGDDRKSVRAAAAARLAELGEPAGPVDPRSRPGIPLAPGTGNRTVRTQYPIDRFEHGLDGVPVIDSVGVEVDASQIDELLEAAAAHNTPLEEVKA